MPSSAVPVIVNAHEARSAAEALPRALQFTSDPLNVPSAVPDNLSAFAHVALNAPLARFAVCSVACHLKSVQLAGEGTTFDDVQLPIKAPAPDAVGAAGVVFRSNPKQADVAITTSPQTLSDTMFLMVLSFMFSAFRHGASDRAGRVEASGFS
jgi:hypothetical protein